MRKKQDIMWEQSTLWESVEKWVTKYLKKSHSEYRKLQAKAMRIVEENPALRILINSMEGIVLTPEDHKALHKYIETKDEMIIFEYEYYYLAGQMMTFSYGRMLAQLKNEMLNEDSEASTHLIELLTRIRSDELEKQLLDESEEYQNCIKEEEDSEAEVKRKLSSKEWKLVDRYVTAVNNRWLCCGDYLYQSGMKDVLLLLENK